MKQTISPHLPFVAYLFLALVYLGVQMFQGLSYLDISMYMSGYSHFNDEPYMSYFLGQWLLSYSLTGWLCKVFAINTFFGIRVIHLIYIAILQCTIYIYLHRHHIDRRCIIGGLALATLAHFGSYTEINYNDYSTGLFTLAIFAFHSGATGEKRWPLLLSGAIVGAAFFFRVTNITFVILPFISWLTSVWTSVKTDIKTQFALFFSGVAAGCAIVVALLGATGLLDILSLTIHDMTNICGNPKDAHSLKAVIISMYSLYKGIIAGFSCVLLCSYLMYLACKSKTAAAYKLLYLLSLSLMIILLIYLKESAANITIGVCVTGLILYLLSKRASDSVTLLYALSLCIPIVFPIGSNAGPEFYGKDVCFATLPLALYGLRQFGLSKDKVMRRSYTLAVAWSYAAVCMAMIYTNIKRPMMEDGNRLECRYTIDSNLTRHVFTTRENADMNNLFIKEVKPFVPDGSYMICTFSPTSISLLGCKPYAVYSTVFTSDLMNHRYIDVAYKHSGQLPYLLICPETDSERDKEVVRYLETFAPYKQTWSKGGYVLLKPVL